MIVIFCDKQSETKCGPVDSDDGESAINKVRLRSKATAENSVDGNGTTVNNYLEEKLN